MASSNALHHWRVIGPSEENILERQYEYNPNPSSATKMSLALKLHVSPQNIGRWFSARRRREAGLARASRKTPEQLSLLEEFFKHTHFPTQEQKENLAHGTHLSYKQVNSWFQNQRKKHGLTSLENLPSRRLILWHQSVAAHIRSQSN